MQKEKVINNKKPQKDQINTLKQSFPHCFDKNGNFDFDKFKKELDDNEDIDFSRESYSMEWLGKSYARLLASDETKTLLKEDENWNNQEENKNVENLLIKGDNLEVLKHLSHAYHEKVKMIYTDPPYNTGGDGFVYEDDRKFNTEELSKLAGIDEEKAKRILDFTQSKSNSHSAWLTFMYPRLYIAKELLQDDGVIFISIDDHEVAQLRLMMDEIFGEDNFIESFIWRSRLGKGSTSVATATIHEYILCYSKNGKFIELAQDVRKRYTESKERLRQWGQGDLREDRPSMFFPIQSEEYGDVYPRKPDGSDGRWRSGKDKVSFLQKNKMLVFEKQEDGRVEVYRKFPEGQETKTAHDSILKNEIVKTTANGSKELSALFEHKPFDYPKPTNLINFLIVLCYDTNAIVLDFFSGSGTTGDAVMQHNTEDNGSRRFILVQLPEPIDPKKNKTAYNFVKNQLKIEHPTIFDICKERLIRAGKKVNNELDIKIEDAQKRIKKLQEELPTEENQKEIETLKQKIALFKKQKAHNHFKVFETIPIWEDYNLKAEKFDSQIKLFNENSLDNDDLKTLLTTWKTYDGFPLTKNLNLIDLNDYPAYYLDNKVYLIDKGFQTKNIVKLLEEIDSNDDFSPSTIIVFGYNFQSKMLREIADNVKNYTNKKSIDIDFIIRY